MLDLYGRSENVKSFWRHKLYVFVLEFLLKDHLTDFCEKYYTILYQKLLGKFNIDLYRSLYHLPYLSLMLRFVTFP
jgi:hypothetical protein